MAVEMRKIIKESIEEMFESMPPEMWCGMSALLLDEAKQTCVEYYAKGQRALEEKWLALLAGILSGRNEEG